MISELGHWALITALLIATVQFLVLFSGYFNNWRTLLQLGPTLAVTQFVLVAISFAALTTAFVSSDFSLALVVLNSHTLKPLLYKITGVWGNHEGSMLLWILVLSLYGFLVGMWGHQLPIRFKALVLAIQSLLAFGFLSFILFTSNPFARLAVPPFDGQDLNPLLQDPGLAFHPPVLYLGYVGLSITFSFAIAGLIYGNIGSAWARWTRPWTLAAWIFLTLGIALGSWWAYYELGWGGWWFWDPVENASFMPWLITTALLHSTIVLEKRECFGRWVILLAILAFSFSLIGTFLVRSGIITSVHAFASDPTRGIYILALMLFFSGGGFFLYFLRNQVAQRESMFELLSKETALLTNNLLLVVSTLVVLLGTFWPLIVEILDGNKISVGAPYFNLAFTPFFVALTLLLPFGVLFAWKKANMPRTLRVLRPPMLFAMFVGGIVFFVQSGNGILGPVGCALAVWLMLGSIWELGVRTGFGKHKFVRSIEWFRRLPCSEIGKALGHIGLGFTILGIASVSSWELEDIRIAVPGESYEIGSYEFRFRGVTEVMGSNYLALQGDIRVFRNATEVAILKPEKRFYPVAQTTTTEAAIDMGLLRDLYVVLGDQNEDRGWVIRTYIKPMVNWIWIGAIVMAAGGAMSLTGFARSTATNKGRHMHGPANAGSTQGHVDIEP